MAADIEFIRTNASTLQEWITGHKVRGVAISEDDVWHRITSLWPKIGVDTAETMLNAVLDTPAGSTPGMRPFERAQISREDLAHVGHLLHGTDWQGPFAQELSQGRTRRVSLEKLHHWLYGSRPIPAWVDGTVDHLIKSGITGLKMRLHGLEKMQAQLDDTRDEAPSGPGL